MARSQMSAIAAHSRAAVMAVTAESLSLYVPDTASNSPLGESSLNSKPPRLVGISSNVPVMVYIVLRLGARFGQAGTARWCLQAQCCRPDEGPDELKKIEGLARQTECRDQGLSSRWCGLLGDPDRPGCFSRSEKKVAPQRKNLPAAPPSCTREAAALFDRCPPMREQP